MKLRRISTGGPKFVQAFIRDQWVNLKDLKNTESIASEFGANPDLATNILSVLQLGKNGWAALEERLAGVKASVESNVKEELPFQPASFRDFMLSEQHAIDSKRGYVTRFIPQMLPMVNMVEKLTGKPFKKFKPHDLWYKQPIYYLSNHLNIGTTLEDVSWPSYTDALDYELELGAILVKPLFNSTAEQATDAIGGFVVLNDFSARDVQKDEMESGFGPQKTKHFKSTISSVVVTSDEILPFIDELVGTVTINGNDVSTCHNKDMQFTMGEAIAFASKEEHLYPGELFGSGTLPGGSGLETGNWIKRGDTLSLTIDRIGTLTNTIS